MPFTPHITPLSYYDELGRQTRCYVLWLQRPRERIMPQDAFLHIDKPSARKIKQQILAGI